jgi:hypothetical protein
MPRRLARSPEPPRLPKRRNHLNIGEMYKGVEIVASSPEDLEQKRRDVDRAIARRLCSAPDAAARASILRELHSPT